MMKRLIRLVGQAARVKRACLLLMALTVLFAATAAPANDSGMGGVTKIGEGFGSPTGMAFDHSGNLYVAEWGHGRIVRIDSDGGRTVFAGKLDSPAGLAFGADGMLYAALYSGDAVLRFDADGHPAVYADGLATPTGIAFDLSGGLLVANRRAHEIVRIGRDGVRTVVVDGLDTPVGVLQMPDGAYVVSDFGGSVTIVGSDGGRVEAESTFEKPGVGVASTRSGRVFVVDYGSGAVFEIFRDGHADPVVKGLSGPVGLAVTPDDSALLIATWGDGAIYRLPVPSSNGDFRSDPH